MLDLLFWPPVFWTVVAALFVFGTVQISLDKDQGNDFSTSSLIVSILILSLMVMYLNINGHWIVNHLGSILLWVLFYLVVGILWATTKWVILVFKVRNKFDSIVEACAAKNNVEIRILKGNYGPLKELYEMLNHRSPLKLYSARSNADSDFESIKQAFRPTPEKHKAMITSWIVNWPTSMISFCVKDAVRGTFNLIFRGIRNFYQGISNRIFN